jgi:hypothetical protein
VNIDQLSDRFSVGVLVPGEAISRHARVFKIENHEHLIFSGSVPSVGPCMRVQHSRRGNAVSDRRIEVRGPEIRNLDLGDVRSNS